MNNAGRINAGRINVQKMKGSSVERYRSGGRDITKAAPFWLVMICRFILWLTSDEVSGIARALFAVGAVGALAIVAGAMESGAVPFVYGCIICASLGAMALLATREG